MRGFLIGAALMAVILPLSILAALLFVLYCLSVQVQP